MLDNIASLRPFAPELVLSAGVLLLLLADLIAGRASLRRSAALALLTLTAAALATLLTAAASVPGEDARHGLFGGLIARDPFADFFKLLSLLACGLVGTSALAARDAIEHQGERAGKEAAEFYVLVLTLALGTSLMAASTDLLMAFLSLELVSITSYILAGFKRRDRRSSEAALKYIIYGSVAAGVMLFGMSLLYGLAGATQFSAIREAAQKSDAPWLVLTAVTLCLAGFGYKIAAVPFHMWCPDVYEGAPTPVSALLSVGPKAAGFALLIRFFGDGQTGGAIPGQLGDISTSASVFLHGAPWPLLLGLLAAASMTLGNLAAIVQSNLKRMLAYSSIAHAGYLLLGLCAGGLEGQRAILLYLVTYLFMNLGAFGVILALSEAGIGEDIADYRGMGYRAPFVAVTMTVFLFSLTGLPPFAGFFGKLYLFAALIHRGGTLLVALALVGILNSAVSLYYYARILKAMYFERAGAPAVTVPRLHAVQLGVLAAMTTGLVLVWSPLLGFVEGSLVQWYPPASALVQGG